MKAGSMEPIKPSTLFDLLGLVMEHPPEIATIGAWTEKQRLAAELWAGREHLVASDNPLPRIPKPDFLCAEEIRIGLVELFGILESQYPAYDERAVNKVIELQRIAGPLLRPVEGKKISG